MRGSLLQPLDSVAILPKTSSLGAFFAVDTLSVLFAVTYGVWRSQSSFEPAASPLRSVESLGSQKPVDVALSRVLGIVRERPLRSRDQLHRVRLGVSHLHRRLERGGR